MSFQPLFKASDKPRWQKPSAHAFIRSELRIETWMLLGAIGQSLLAFVLPARLAFLPAAIIILLKFGNAYAMKTGLRRNTQMDGVIMTKFSAQFPDKLGDYGNQPARDGVAVFMIGARNNSPLGMLDPKFKEVGDFFQRMMTELEANADKMGFLGTSSWSGTERATSPSLMNVMYFKSAAHVHEYAHGPLHRETWNWWYKNIKDLKEISIYHELYEVPSGNYETIYDQMPPMLAAATQHKVVRKTEQGEREEWMSPVVDARKGQLKTSRGRMARSKGVENDKYGLEDPYANVEVKPMEAV